MNKRGDRATEISEERISTLLERVGPRPQPSPPAMEAAREKVREAWQESVAAERRRRQRWTTLAAAASVVLSLGAGLWLAGRPAPDAVTAHVAHTVNTMQYRAAGEGQWTALPENGELALGDALRLPADSYAELELGAGLHVRLDSGSEIELRDAAELYLRAGALYADAPGEGTLTVLTDAGTARDIGTRFEVRITDTGWRVQVREGQVIVDDRRAGTATASAGERLIARGDDYQRETVGAADASWQWTNAAARPPAIEGSTLDSYLHWWSRESGVRVRFERPIDASLAAQTQLHGSLDGLSLEEGFRVVVAGSGYRVVDRSATEVMLAR
jgi:ferric-dicitrate binding protein FerR (iron transport regulator)